MSKKRGLSLEEKRTRLLELFFEKKEFFLLKELEKIAPKEKGITSMSVKEVLQTLVDDNLVDTDKIGTSIYFWAYPSKAMHTRQKNLQQLTEQINECEKKLASTTKLLKQANSGREQSDDRAAILQELMQKKKLCKEQEEQLEKYRECDPEVLQNMQKETVMAKEGANRWTDNVFTIKSWCVRKFGLEDKMIDKNFGIPEEFDYVE
ncbi:Meiotic nuclear division protein 1 [Desmophyllum pertusum]|uniref:Meiotic nuclear division protein 1 homolog n=1 Tax=Desmophyllum pertusum TaxID=174260 RepID=A0A9W9YFV2_9CNID|nr:Meiotic nuclear division protein 1 [Desmophyllum pertusum]